MFNEYETRLKNIFLDPQIVKSFDFISKIILYKKDDIIYKQGEQNEQYLILENGILTQQLHYIEIGIVQQTIKCLSDCKLRAIDEQQYQMLIKAKNGYQKMIFQFLSSLPLFSGKKFYSLNFEFEDFKLGQTSISSTSSCKQMIIIYDGEFVIRKKWNKGYIDIGQLTVGEVINEYECIMQLPQQFHFVCKSQVAKVIKIFDYRKILDINDLELQKATTEKLNYRITRFKRMTDFKSGNCLYQQPPEPEILPLRDIVNQVQTAQSRQRQPLPLLIDEEVKKKVQIKMGTYKQGLRKRVYSQMS